MKVKFNTRLEVKQADLKMSSVKKHLFTKPLKRIDMRNLLSLEIMRNIILHLKLLLLI